MKIKSFECPKSIRNYKNIMLGTSDAWSTSCLSHQHSKPAYYIEYCQISRAVSLVEFIILIFGTLQFEILSLMSWIKFELDFSACSSM